MTRDYNLTIKFDGTDTLTKIHDEKLQLLIFKSLKASKDGGEVLVWQAFDHTKMVDGFNLGWDNEFGAFVSYENFSSLVDYSSVNSKPIEFGETLDVHKNSTVTVERIGKKGCISILNESEEQDYSCGISQKDDAGKVTPMCAFPLLSTFIDRIIPIERVALIFSTGTQKTATVYEVSNSPGIIVDLTDPDARERVLTYNRHHGWEADTKGKSEVFSPNSDLSNLLIKVDISLEETVVSHSWD